MIQTIIIEHFKFRNCNPSKQSCNNTCVLKFKTPEMITCVVCRPALSGQQGSVNKCMTYI